MIFKSIYKELRLVVKPEQKNVTNMGVSIVPGEAIEFKNFLYETEDKKEIKFIKSNRLFGAKIIEIPSVEEQEDKLIQKAEAIKAKRGGKGKASKVEAMVKKSKKSKK